MGVPINTAGSVSNHWGSALGSAGIQQAGSAVGSFTGALANRLDWKHQQRQADYYDRLQRGIMKYQGDLNFENWRKQFDRTNAYNSPAAQRARMEEAGFNIGLMYGKGGLQNASAQMGGAANVGLGSSKLGQSGVRGGMSVSDLFAHQRIKNETSIAEAQSQYLKAQTQTEGTKQALNRSQEALNNANSRAIGSKQAELDFYNSIWEAANAMVESGIEVTASYVDTKGNVVTGGTYTLGFDTLAGGSVTSLLEGQYKNTLENVLTVEKIRKTGKDIEKLDKVIDQIVANTNLANQKVLESMSATERNQYYSQLLDAQIAQHRLGINRSTDVTLNVVAMNMWEAGYNRSTIGQTLGALAGAKDIIKALGELTPLIRNRAQGKTISSVTEKWETGSFGGEKTKTFNYE